MTNLSSLPDFMTPGLEILVVGLNPSPMSVARGVPFANPRNRFWPALQRSDLLRAACLVTPNGLTRLMQEERIGFTDLVKRPSAGARDLTTEDFRRDAPTLTKKINRYKPRNVWFQGKLTYANYLRHGWDERARRYEWGEPPSPWTDCAFFVTPNPSSANANYSLDDIIAWMNRFARFVGRR